jgi:3-oxoacyl-[acyl-carrier protein] reductase
MTDNTPDSIVVLGATGSVGQATLRQLHAGGARIFAAGRNAEKLQALSGSCEATGIFEASEAGSIEKLVEEAASQIGPITGIVNCVGSILLKPAHLTTDEEFAAVLDINLLSSFRMLRAAAKVMRQNGGAIVFASTAAAQIGIPSHEAIAAAKAGIEGMARSAAATYARSGIRVNVVAPGLVKSEMSRSIWSNEAAAEASRDMHALGRLGEPEDIASLICWLLDSRNNWITGQVIAVDGGLSSVMQRQKR